MNMKIGTFLHSLNQIPRAIGCMIAWIICGSSTFASSLPNFIACESDDAQSIAFTDWAAKDEVKISVIGNDCANSVILISIRNESGALLFAHAAIFHRLTVIPPNSMTGADVERVQIGVRGMLGPNRTSQLQPWRGRQEVYDLYEEIPLLGQKEYEAARSEDRPFICVQTYYEGADCYWYNPKSGTQKIMRLAD